MDYFHLISGADYPCQSNSEFDKFFENNEGKSYMMFDTEEETIEWRKKKYPDRYRLYHFNDKGYNNNSIVNVLKLPIKIFQKAFHIYLRPMIKDVYAGWEWFSWHRKVAEFAMRQLDEHPEHLERMRYCSCIDEVFFIPYYNRISKSSMSYQIMLYAISTGILPAQLKHCHLCWTSEIIKVLRIAGHFSVAK